MSNSRLARAANVAESTAHARVTALIEAGFIRGFRADVDLSLLGASIEALILVKVRPESRVRLRDEAERLAACPGVLEVLFLGGQYDLAVKVAVADPAQLRDFVMNELSRHPEIAGTETCLVLEDLIGTRPPGLEPTS